ncbi:acetate--CoA ligase family protein [Pseudonocardia humida]|uniref:Acetate--CoA ligase family protein n=1 Tax=Pseudonocardia humida TaxID=2800819 RepID=A0ABT1A254_9PSEU|nr:acetate--CoA ligase family protein [Pseudonocardia humida]MCO1657072.1 acetate--CoA ligase family protein [Pseudonocardia humida]
MTESATRTAGTALEALFRPRAVAILGASGRPGNPFARPLQYLQELGFTGGIHPVNPNYVTLRGIPCHPGLDVLPEPVDLVLMLVAAGEVARQLPAVAAAGAKAAVVFASGFAEVGPDGLALQRQMVATARDHGVRLLGPNCQGVLSVHDRMAATFTAALETGLPRPGDVAYIGQSGAVGGSVLSLARERGLGIGAWTSTGNQADLSALEIGTYLVEDPRIEVLTLYLESPVDGVEYARLVGRARELGKAVLVLRSARSGAGARAAASHTGAIIGPDAAFRAMSAEYGVIEADDVEDFVATAQALSSLPRAAGRRLAVVTTSGGAGSLAADQAEDVGLVVEPLTADTQQRLVEVVPAFGAVTNPVDVTAQMFRNDEVTEFVQVCRTVLADPGVDAVLVALTMVTGQLATRMAAGLAEVWDGADKPMEVVWLAGREQTAEARAMLRDQGRPVLDSPRLATRVLRALVRADPPRSAHPLPVPAAAPAALPAAGGVLTEATGAVLLDALGVARPAGRLVRTGAQAAEVAAELGGPLVLKIQSPGILHKTERGGVRVGVAVDAAATAVDELLAAFAGEDVDGVLVQAMAGSGPELVVGLTNDEPGFPPLLTVGIGGTATELYRDTVSRLAPVDPAQAEAMVRALRAAPLLTGHRGAPGHDLAAAARAIALLSSLAVELGDRLAELEINPLRLGDGGATAVALDFLMRLHPTPEPGGPRL